MKKAIQFTRYEDVRVTYTWTMQESDWEDFKDWNKDDAPAYAVIKDMTLDEAAAFMNGEGEEPSWEEPFYDGISTYTVYLSEAIKDYLRDIAIDAGSVDESYYDDGADEYVEIIDCPC